MIRLLFSNKLIWLIFFVAVFVRMLYFPNNVYFAYDQARDAFAAQEILKGDIKIIGPPSAASDKLFPGPLVYYLLGPIYAIFDKSPDAVSAFLRIYNALGIILIFAIGSALFSRKVALIAAFLFAVSYEQSQYALFISHQPMAVLPVLALYLGLALYLFKQQKMGLILAAAGWGLSIQFHYVYLLLTPVLLALIFVFRKNFFALKPRDVATPLLVFLLAISSYILAEIKFQFRFTQAALAQTTSFDQTLFHPDAALYATKRFLHDTFLANYELILIPAILILVALVHLVKSDRAKGVFITLWFLGGILPYAVSGSPSYYYSAAASVSLLILTANFITSLIGKRTLLGFGIIAGILLNNIYLIRTVNPRGPNADIVIQPGMLLSDQKAALDHIYSNANGKPFAVRSLTIPFDINTTWSYLFEWYGREKYNYLPVWIGPIAKGYPGNIHAVDDRSRLPELQFLIMEPTKGLHVHTIDDFFREEGYFTQVVEQKSFGTITVEWRRRI